MNSPLKERDRLVKVLIRAQDDYSRSVGERQQAERERSVADRALREASRLAMHSKGGEDAFVTAETRVDDKREAERRWLDRSNRALDVCKEVEFQLDVLYREHTAEFAEEAEQVTQAAAQALDALRDALGAAWEAWEHAERTWRPICKAHGLQGVPPCPLTKPEALLDVMPRPPQVVLVS
jgi:hypothetical protein